MNTENTDSQETSFNNSADRDKKTYTKKGVNNKVNYFKLKKWEVVLLGLSVIMVAFIAMPNYFHALETLRGEGCSTRLTLLANCLQYLSEKNNTQPGDKICELFDLNELLTQVQGGGSFISTQSDLPMFFKVGAEPDCPDPSGDYTISLFLDEQGNIIPPKCSIAEGEDHEYYHNQGIHTALMEEVDGKPFVEENNPED